MDSLYDNFYNNIVSWFLSGCKRNLAKGGLVMTVYTPYITKNGKRIYASQYGLKVFAFEVDDAQHEEYLKRKRKEKSNE